MRLVLTLFLFATAAPGGATAPALENLDQLDARIAVFLGGTAADAGQRAQPVDRRLRLSHCVEGVVFDAPAQGAIAARCVSTGWRLRVTLIGTAAAQPSETVIRRGDAVELSYVGSGFDVTTVAIALEDGHDGGAVRVKSPTGVTTLTARVRGPGRVSVGN
jgi:flagellar basal body P-ring formation protein FlgA